MRPQRQRPYYMAYPQNAAEPPDSALHDAEAVALAVVVLLVIVFLSSLGLFGSVVVR